MLRSKQSIATDNTWMHVGDTTRQAHSGRLRRHHRTRREHGEGMGHNQTECAAASVKSSDSCAQGDQAS